MLTTRSSNSCCRPISFITLSACLRPSGSGIFTLGLPRKPSSAPSLATAAAEPFSSAAFTPAVASARLSDETSSARTGVVASRPAATANVAMPSSTGRREPPA
jgi:hypothetical protein